MDDDGIEEWDAVEYLRKRVPQAQYARRSFDRGAYRNALFFLGIHWLKFNRNIQQWKPITLPDYFPKQVTNMFAKCCDMMKSVLMQSDPVSLFSPASGNPEDIASARAAEDISRQIEQDVDQSLLESLAATWDVIAGNAFIVDGFDNDKKYGTKFIQDNACLDCFKFVQAEEAEGGCPYCGGGNLIEAHDESGQPMGQDVPIGRVFSEIASPFEIHFDLVSGTFDQSPYVYRARTYPVEVIKDMFPDHEENISADDAGVDSGMFYQTALAYATNGVSSSPGNYGGAPGSVDNTPRATLYHLWVRPTQKLPKGGEALIVGNTCLWSSSLCYHDEDGNPIIPVTHIGFNMVAGRALAKSPADDLVPKQVQRNKIEAFIQLSLSRTANGTWLLPKSIGIDAITGEPGEKIWYNAFNGIKPERLPGSDLPGSVFRWLLQLDNEMNDLAHTNDVLRGKQPEGIPTLGGIQLLLERGFAGFADALKSWGRGWNKSRRNRLLIWREYVSDERTTMVLGENREWEAKKFSKEALKGRFNVYLEEASIAPKSKAYQQLVVGQLLQQPQPIIDISDPEVRVSILQLFDASDLVGNMDVDILDAVKEKEEFLKTGHLRPRKGIDSDPVHSAQHKKWAKSDEFKKLPPQVQAEFIQHIFYHDKNVSEQQQAAQQNDPRLINAQAKLKEIQLEIQALGQQKSIEIDHLQKRKNIDLQAHGMKKGFDMMIAAQHAKANLDRNGKPI